ncbi:MAG: putative hydrolase or acyltransferases (alpha/beta hydrolase superfamily) [Halonotius sp. J07HN4]|jgi:Predicted hydrolases or acyltransferases (alpha/beta hydrolase superfamily)|nr:MAG: putative hydrolase or acyltransferases (alpha/beta hydrolase superfamily) [Halonotius sp. J07HN4]
MPYADANGCEIHYTRGGENPDAPAVVLLGELGLGAWQWSWQYGALAGPCRTIVVDPRGAGRSDTPAGPYTMGDLVGDLEAVLTDCSIRAAHLVGCGLGGAVALAAARRTNRARSLTLVGTPPSRAAFDPDPLSPDPDDTAGLRASTTSLLSTSFVDREDAPVEQITEWRREEDATPTAREAQLAALDGFDPEPLYELTLPARVVTGENDPVVDPEASRRLAKGLPKGEFKMYPEAGHLVTVERSAALNDFLLGFVESVADR